MSDEQQGLFPQVRRCSRGWSNRCPKARRPRCTCACGGHNHGTTHQAPSAEPPAEPKPKEQAA